MKTRSAQGDAASSSLPCVPPHVGIPAALVHLDEVEVGEHAAIVSQSVLLDHVRDESIGLIVVPATLAHEAVVDEDLLVRQSAAVGEAPVENLGVALPGKDLRLDVLVTNPQ